MDKWFTVKTQDMLKFISLIQLWEIKDLNLGLLMPKKKQAADFSWF